MTLTGSTDIMNNFSVQELDQTELNIAMMSVFLGANLVTPSQTIRHASRKRAILETAQLLFSDSIVNTLDVC